MDKHQDLYDKVIDFAKNNSHIRLVEMNGSRVNPKIEPDDFQDFDMVFYVDDYKTFMSHDHDFIDRFGEILIMQTKDDQVPEQGYEKDWYIYLIQFLDGTRLDLTIMGIDDFDPSFEEDSLSKIVLDKDNHHRDHSPNESTYYVTQPTKKKFSMTVNEFYWLCPYVGKGLARNHIFYALKHLDIIRNQLEYMIDWWVGMNYDYQISVGKGKHRYDRFLPKKWFDTYKKSYVRANIDDIWTTLFQVIDLFDVIALDIQKEFLFDYDTFMKPKMIDFLKEHYKVT